VIFFSALRGILSAALTAPIALTFAAIGAEQGDANAPFGSRYDLIKWRYA